MKDDDYGFTALETTVIKHTVPLAIWKLDTWLKVIV